ncbi:serine threonine protein kinase [Stylonychia lemnae]|uniref:non-specific serine/threonine protein kinase n=1 Tax=Stylonychia lemnae TaxID=5949 RepID=A0A078BAK4_STYLE|nr:serine threonine protein kinase [Stylonychia lemnae]|eukprot:CDW90598.1 serine threonine protein kinase [Stylonychia lemnae]
MVVLVEDIIDPTNPRLFKSSQNDEQGGHAHHDRLRRLFSKRIYRGPKTPPRRIQTDQISNSLLLDIHYENQSQEACSVFIKEESNPSILYTCSKKFAMTEQSKMLGQGIVGMNLNQRNHNENMRKEFNCESDDQMDHEGKIRNIEETKDDRFDQNKLGQKILNKNPNNKKKSKKRTTKQQQQQLQNQMQSQNQMTVQQMQSPKKSGRARPILKMARSGSIQPPGQGIGFVMAVAQSQDEESNTLGLSMDSYKDQIYDNNIKSLNSSNMPIGKKTKTIGNISRSRIGKHKNVLSRKAFQVAENARNQVISFQNLFVSEGNNYTQHYKSIKKIGQGGCGEVFMVMHLATDQIRAMKIIKKNSEKIVSSVFDEIKILKQLDHPNIVQVYEYFQDELNVYIIMEYLKGGSLFDRLKAINRFGEREAAYVMKQVLQALNYCFQKNIVHRDMKLENILFVQEDTLQIKIIDFGSAVYVDNQTKNLNRIVTAYYVAPEIINKEEQIMKCDVWSCGVILFILLSGQAPFRGKDEQEILDKVLKNQVNFEENQWKSVSRRAKNLIKQMIETNVVTRLSLLQCIQSPWIKMLTKIDGSFRIDMHQIAKTIRLLEAFQPGCRLRMLCLNYAIRYFSFDSHVDKFIKFYSYMDSRHVANLNERDLLKFAQRINKEEDLEILLQQQKRTVAKLDLEKLHGITFTQFLIGTLDISKSLSSQKLIKLFNIFDVDGDNYISVKDLHAFCSKKIEIDQCKSIIEQALEYLNGGGQRSPQNLNQSIALNNQNPPELLKINFSNFKQIVLNQIQTGPPQVSNTAYINNNSYLMMADGKLNQTQIDCTILIQNNANPGNQSVQNSGILYQAGINSNTGNLISPISKLLKNEPKEHNIKRKNKQSYKKYGTKKTTAGQIINI